MTGLHRVSLPWATFGLVTDGTKVTDAAPIARWTVGKDKRYMFDYYLRKGATLRSVGQ